MAISLFFSANVYQLSMQEFDKGVNLAPDVIMQMPDYAQSGMISTFRNQIQDERKQRYNEARARVLSRLFMVNLVILAGGGFLCYHLARRTLQPIEEAHEVQSRFTADASHELRTPIAAMQSETEVALMNPKLTLEKAKDLLRSNLEELGKLTKLSEGLLRLAQLENNDLHRQQISLGRVAQDAVSRVLPLAEAKNILISSDVPSNLRVMGEEVSLAESLIILLDNAVKYSPEKTEVNISAHKTQKHVVVTVQDHGAGIKATELPHIFDRFYRADTARSKQHANGYGLGLAIAKNIVDMHGGSLSAQSRIGVGSTFTIQLPKA
ncbi:MAG TPA: HAMP domain-containing sensor histidine kinase [Candidatus Saccharimonadales bacterium]